MTLFQDEIKRRRTFAIISHPDAGKTTMTEKLLLYSGQIHMAGSVKARRAKKHAISDWMELEKEKGISITSSVLQFEYAGLVLNLLDTPGHADFSEDTYRVLTAVDSALMLIDHSKGVEPQTRKLFAVCRSRRIPIFTFMNKLDRAGQDPYDLMHEIESIFGVECVPINFPVGRGGRDFKGVCDLRTRMATLLKDTQHGTREGEMLRISIDDPQFLTQVGAEIRDQLLEDLEMLNSAGNVADPAKLATGDQTAVFWGSAMTNFGVQPFLETFVHLAPAPHARQTKQRNVNPEEEDFSGFIFKIQANLDPRHRDRIAFMRICSGLYKSGMRAVITRTGKDIKATPPQQFLAQERKQIEQAYPGDIVGVYDPGIFHIGDTITTAKDVEFDDVPVFSPEMFGKVILTNPLKRKQLQTGLRQLTEEGAIQLFQRWSADDLEPILGAVGELQFVVMEYRLKAEYGAEICFEMMPYRFARWLSGPEAALQSCIDKNKKQILRDRWDNPVLLFESEWQISFQKDKNPDLTFHDTHRKKIAASPYPQH